MSHTLLVHKLRHYGIGGRLNAWIDSFLKNRQQAVVDRGERSSFMPVDSGVPQQSVVGPCLFLLYINGLPIDIESKIRLFADDNHDTVCNNTIKHKEDQKKLQKDFDSPTIYMGERVVHELPSTEMLHVECHPKEKDNCTVIPTTSTRTQPAKRQHSKIPWHKHTGDNLNWGLHIDTITNKENKTFGFLRRNLKIGNKKTKETAYKAFVHPILEYLATVWDQHTANDIKSSMPSSKIWVTNRHHQTSCVNSIIDSLAWPTLQQRLKCFTNFTTASSPLVPNTYHSQLKTDQATERTTHTATTSPAVGHSTDRSMSFFPRTIPEWNNLPQEIVASKSLDCFKSWLAAHL